MDVEANDGVSAVEQSSKARRGEARRDGWGRIIGSRLCWEWVTCPLESR